MMAAGWRLVGDIIRDLIDEGLDDALVKSQLKSSPSLRSKFLVLYDAVNVLVQAGQTNFAVLATAAREYMSCISNHAPASCDWSWTTTMVSFLPGLSRQAGFSQLHLEPQQFEVSSSAVAGSFAVVPSCMHRGRAIVLHVALLPQRRGNSGSVEAFSPTMRQRCVDDWLNSVIANRRSGSATLTHSLQQRIGTSTSR